MAILVISVTSDSSEDSVGTPAGRVILFGTIPMVKDNTEKDKIRAKTRQNQEQTGSVEKSKVKPDKVKAQSKPKRHQMEENITLGTKFAKS
nr:hypothetical protein [Tanacetum cinerariifolium]